MAHRRRYISRWTYAQHHGIRYDRIHDYKINRLMLLFWSGKVLFSTGAVCHPVHRDYFDFHADIKCPCRNFRADLIQKFAAYASYAAATFGGAVENSGRFFGGNGLLRVWQITCFLLMIACVALQHLWGTNNFLRLLSCAVPVLVEFLIDN